MTDEKKAQLIRRLIMVGVFAVAIVAGYFVKLPVWDSVAEKKEEAGGEEKDKAFREAIMAEDCLTVVNAMVDGNPDSEKLKKLLEQLKKDKYGDQVQPVDLDVEEQETIAAEHGIDLEEFAGQLDFYVEGQKLGTLRGETDPVVVEETIDRYLRGLVKRFGPDWLPEVRGMSAGKGKPQVPGATGKPTGVPGMQRTSSPVPGMTRSKPGQNTLKVESADKQKE